MFDTICLKFDQRGHPTDLGLIAESLLYYKQVIVVGKPDILPPILNNVSKDVLVELMLRGSLKFCILRDFFAATGKDTEIGMIPTSIIRLQPAERSTEDQVFVDLYNSNERRGFSKRLLQNILPYIEFISYPAGTHNLIENDLYDSDYVKKVFLHTVKRHIPNFNINPEQLILEFTKGVGGTFGLNTNLNFNDINRMIPNNPKGDRFNSVSIVTNIEGTRGDLHLASMYNAELVSYPAGSSLISLKFDHIYQKITNNRESIYQFNNFILDNGYAIREAINNGQYSFDDYISILNKASKFKSWLQEGEDIDLIKKYHQAVTKKTFLEKMPSKVLRWGIFTGLGLAVDLITTAGIGTAVGLAVSVGDSFLLDRVASGWKPNIFIEEELKKVTQK